jgi:hypothetical protein
MQPMPGAPMMGMGGPAGPHGPPGNVRNPVVVFLLSMCGLPWIFMLWSMVNELNAFRQKNDLNPIMFFIPIVNIIQIWGLPPKVLEAQQMAGVPQPAVSSPILYLFFAPYFFTVDLNKAFEAAGGRQQPPPQLPM